VLEFSHDVVGRAGIVTALDSPLIEIVRSSVPGVEVDGARDVFIKVISMEHVSASFHGYIIALLPQLTGVSRSIHT